MLTLREDYTLSETLALLRRLELDAGGPMGPPDVPADVGQWGNAPILVGAILTQQDRPVKPQWVRPLLQAFLDTLTRPLRKTVVRGSDGTLHGVVSPQGTFTPDRNGGLTSGRAALEAALTSEEEVAMKGGDGRPEAARHFRLPEGEAGASEPASIEETEAGWAIDPPLTFRQSGVVGGFAVACRALSIDPLALLRGQEPDVEAPSADAVELLLEATCTNAAGVELGTPPPAVTERLASKIFASYCNLHAPRTAVSFARKNDEVEADG